MRMDEANLVGTAALAGEAPDAADPVHPAVPEQTTSGLLRELAEKL